MSQHAGTADPGGEIVVVIDDELSVRELLCTVLELDGYQVYVALNGPLGLGLIDAMRPAVVLLDVMMPGMDGVDVCYLIDHEQVGVIVLTARDDPDLEARCLAAGADRFMTKPMNVSALSSAVAELATARVGRRPHTIVVE